MDQLGIPNIFTSTFNRLKINQNYLDLVVICNYVMYVIFLSKLITMNVVGILQTTVDVIHLLYTVGLHAYDTYMRNLSLFLYLLTQYSTYIMHLKINLRTKKYFDILGLSEFLNMYVKNLCKYQDSIIDVRKVCIDFVIAIIYTTVVP